MVINVTMMSAASRPILLTIYRFAPLAILLCLGLTYGSALHGDFVWDDVFLIRDNAVYDGWATAWQAAWGDFYQHGETSRAQGGYLRPVPVLLNALNIEIFGRDPFTFRVFNGLLHCAAVWLALLCLRQLNVAAGLSVFVAGLFALHPMQTETVLFISCRGDLCAAVGVFGAMYAFLRSRDGGYIWGFIACIAYGFAVLSKEIAIGLPLFLTFLEWMQPRRKLSRTMWLWLIALTYLGFRYTLVDGVERVYFETEDLPLAVVNLLGFYGLRFIWPMHQRVLYEHLPVTELSAYTVVGGLMIAAVAWVMARRSLRCSGLGYGVVWTLLGLGCVVHIVPIMTLASERYLYLPIFGLALIFVTWFQRAAYVWPQMGGLRALWAGIAMLCTMAVMSQQRAQNWQDEITLWQAELKADPNASTAHANLGTAFAERGQHDAAYGAYRTAWQIRPGHPVVFRNLARLEARRLPLSIRKHFLLSALKKRPPIGQLERTIETLQSANQMFAARLLSHRLKALNRRSH